MRMIHLLLAALCVPFALSAAQRATAADSQQQFGLKLELLDLIPKLTVEGPGGQPARVDWAADLAGPWTAWSNVVASAEGVALVDLAPSSVRRFYRAMGSDMALIPAGVFTMGDNRVAGPEHPVQVSAFAIDRTEVTAAFWNQVRTWALSRGYDLAAGGSFGSDHPINNLNWFDVVKWCNARSEKEGLVPAYYLDEARTQVYRSGEKEPFVNWNAGYRLPTEAEWEKAARGGAVGRLYPWADSDEITPERANYNGQFGRTTPVGSYPANGFGLSDMAGNVWEWCWDWYGDYPSGPVTDPRGPASGSARLIRGGGWNNSAEGCRVAPRYTDTPANRGDSIGFRAVLPPGQP